MTIHPDTPLYTSLCRQYGCDVVWKMYFDESMNVLDSAPQQLKDEINLLRKDADECPVYVDGEVIRY